MNIYENDVIPMDVDTDDEVDKPKSPALHIDVKEALKEETEDDKNDDNQNVKIPSYITEDDIIMIDRLPTETISDMFDQMFGFEPNGIHRDDMIEEIVQAYYECEGD